MTDVINVVANDPILMDAASEQTGIAFRQLIPPKRAVLSGENLNVHQTPFEDFTI